MIALLLTLSGVAFDGIPDADGNYAATVGIDLGDGRRCTGVRIASDAVLSAASCVGDQTSGSLQPDGAVISAVQPHPDFNPVNRENDLAVLWVTPSDRDVAQIMWSALDYEGRARVTLAGIQADGIVYDPRFEAEISKTEPRWNGLFSGRGESICARDAGAPVFLSAGGETALLGLLSPSPQTAVCSETEPKVQSLLGAHTWLESLEVDWTPYRAGAPVIACEQDVEDPLAPPVTVSCTAEAPVGEVIPDLAWTWEGEVRDTGVLSSSWTFEEQGRFGGSVCWVNLLGNQDCASLPGFFLCDEPTLEVSAEPVRGLTWSFPVQIAGTPEICLERVSLDIIGPEGTVSLIDQPFRHTFDAEGSYTVELRVGRVGTEAFVGSTQVEITDVPVESSGCASLSGVPAGLAGVFLVVGLRRRRA